MADQQPALDRLLEMGRRQGYVTVDQITETLPVASMSEADIARAIERLEQSGIAVELDDEWVESRRAPDAAASPPADVLPPDETEIPPMGAGASRHASGAARPMPRAAMQSSAPPAAEHRSRSLLMPLLALAAAILVLVVLALGWLA
ncbi:RNA polymerase sigma factor region1.1 domain-containing protein [Arenibaculum pallidiluteum]|uniref:RNA polymerase sigma factor region1.1 domain-containing protein n=1 Tax=Arenibaculum pallidiluteum TaxID=2812559 RepID=UPI001A97D147|nr:RNA polymerase sigma factor region1.1 domain-containing protein [Arenibaculum pallidiluteum]